MWFLARRVDGAQNFRRAAACIPGISVALIEDSDLANVVCGDNDRGACCLCDCCYCRLCHRVVCVCLFYYILMQLLACLQYGMETPSVSVFKQFKSTRSDYVGPLFDRDVLETYIQRESTKVCVPPPRMLMQRCTHPCNAVHGS